MITKATANLARALWVELRPYWEQRLAKVHFDLEAATDLAEVRALQAEAHAYRAFITMPERLDTIAQLDAEQREQDRAAHQETPA